MGVAVRKVPGNLGPPGLSLPPAHLPGPWGQGAPDTQTVTLFLTRAESSFHQARHTLMTEGCLRSCLHRPHQKYSSADTRGGGGGVTVVLLLRKELCRPPQSLGGREEPSFLA